MQVLSAKTAARLRARLDQLATLRRGLAELPARRARTPTPTLNPYATPAEVLAAEAKAAAAGHPPLWEEAAALSSTSRRGGLPLWWGPEHDRQLAEGVVKHGFGAWVQIVTDPATSFEKAALREGAKSGHGHKVGHGQV